ncbi:MAG: rod shape-determining protein MreC [Marinifilaceae bacterium]|jgi:rod shape-determining protein MreC|nr:rod shape-determining protein MreC [Marinifilaceae bacterium]
MRNLFQLFIKYNFIILFIFLEIFCFRLIIGYNSFHRSKFFSSSNTLVGNLYTKISRITTYLSLAKENDELNQENSRLRSLLYKTNHKLIDSICIIRDSSLNAKYLFSPSLVINNSVNRQLNYLTLDKGSEDGIEPGMGIISKKGVIGIIKNVSNNYSTAYSLLNNRIKISAKLKKNNYFGSLSWDGKSYKQTKLNEIPFHADVNIGDTVVTSGYSSTFPPNICLGVVSKIGSSSGGTFHNITIELSEDFKNVTYVNIIHNLYKKEQEKLEEKI